MLNLSKFSQINLSRCISPKGFNHSLESWSVAEWTNAMAGELGEAANLTKKLIRHRDNIAGNIKEEDQDIESLRKRAANEIVDVIIYADLAIQALGGDTSELLVEVFNKKSKDIGCDIIYEEDEDDVFLTSRAMED